MLSILIPIYNTDAQPLIEELQSQISKIDEPIEIVVIDDASDPKYQLHNRKLAHVITYEELEQNIGRAAIRNLLASRARYDHLLFLDGDARVHRPDFLQNYLNSIQKNSDNVIVGGREFAKEKPPLEARLRWKYGHEREDRSLKVRSSQPHASFLTNNFLIPKKIIEKIRFDERLRQYGHEDTLYAWKLMKNGISVNHIDNKILNGDQDSNSKFINNTDHAIDNLLQIYNSSEKDAELVDNVRLLQALEKAKPIRKVLNLIHRMVTPSIRRRLISGRGSLKLLDFYKLMTINARYHETQSKE